MSEIRIVAKKQDIPWDEVGSVLKLAHSENRKAGINMALPNMPSEDLKRFVEGKGGVVFLAMDGETVVGTECIIIKNASLWCGSGVYAYECLLSVHPEYGGRGIYKKLVAEMEGYVADQGVDRILMDTHERNLKILQLKEKAGFKRVGLKVFKDHYSVVLVKWLDKAPYSDFRCRLMYRLISAYKKFRYKPGNVKRFGI